MSGGFLLQAVIYLAAAIICVPIAKKIGMGSVLGYLIAGIAIGPFAMGFIGEEGRDIMHFAEFGVVMMLFLVGLELEPAKFWKMRKMILGMGMLQVAGTSALLFAGGLLFGFSWQSSLACGLALAMSSTAIVLQTLKEKGLLNSASGQSSFAVLLFQDISVIPILAILPVLAVTGIQTDSAHANMVDHLPAWMQTIAVLMAVGSVIVAGRFVIIPLLRLVAKTHLRELFTASALLIVVAIAYIMEQVGLSPALGTFLAGVVLANSEYKHELESDVDPFKGLLLGLFFIAVGASINFDLIASNPIQVVILVIGIMILKAFVLIVTGKLFKVQWDQNILFAICLSQVGEFAFVLFSFINQVKILDDRWTGIMMAVTAITMTITPILLLIKDKLIHPSIESTNTGRAVDKVEEHHQVIIVGFSHFGSTIGRFLRANGVEATILDHDSDRVDLLRKMGFKVYYGDATRVELLQSAGAENAKVLITAIDTLETNQELIKIVQKHFPHLEIMIRSKHRFDAYEIMDLNVKNIYRESIDTSVRLGVDVLKLLGHRHYTAYRAGQNFIKYDEQALSVLASERHDMKQYIVSVRQLIELQEELLSTDRQINPNLNDHAWDSQHMRELINNKK
jgi:CPA2 family monovalent cation:H+ antiporter-2